ncbi:glycosyl hydrolase family 65 protein [Candidatus Omnitrophota bacterium]
MKRLSNYNPSRAQKGETEASWKLSYIGFYPAKEKLREALCTLGNGYFGTRGALPESVASRIHYPGTYIAGVYNKLETHIAGRNITNEDFVNCPNWLFLTFRAGEEPWIVPSECKILFYYQELDMRIGLLSRNMRIIDDKGREFKIETRSLVHMGDKHLASIKYIITSKDYEGPITIRSGLNGMVENRGVARYSQLESNHLRPHSIGKTDDNLIYLSLKTSQSRIIISQASKTRIFLSNKEIIPEADLVTQQKKAVYNDLKIYVRKKQKYEIEKIVSIYTSRKDDVQDPDKAAIESLKPAPRFEFLLKTHKRAWKAIWKKFDIDIQGDAIFSKVLRFHTFHLLQTASFHNVDIDAGFPARGLHGEAYRGHIFWDELFAMPFYNLHAPEISKALLLYRYRRIDQARKSAKENGYDGAMFPWQSGALGDEQTQTIHLNPISNEWGPDNSRLQRHVSFAVAHNAWQYWKSTKDIDFISRYGAEMILSIAKFGSSLVKFDRKDKRYHTEGLMGPDEFHEKSPLASKAGFRDNAYTNLLIVATLRNALKVLNILPSKEAAAMLKRLDINQTDLERWIDITRKMNIVINKNGIISQFDGYFGLKELNWRAYKDKYQNIHRMDRILKAEGKSPNAYKVAKQADALMIFYLLPLSEIKDIFSQLGYRFDPQMLKKNYAYYRRRTSDGSTLSSIVHCYLAHLIGKESEVWQMFLEILKSDIYDTQGGTAPEGIHTGVMSGSIDLTIKCFAGIDIKEDQIIINPRLPKKWRSLKLRIFCKGRWMLVSITKRKLTIFAQGPRSKLFPVPIEIHGKEYTLALGTTHKISLEREAIVSIHHGRRKMAQERILIIDADIRYAFMLKTRLEAMGYLADCVYDGEKALTTLRSGWVDMIIMSNNLKGDMRGLRLFKEIKDNSQFATIPIIVQGRKPSKREPFMKMGAKAFILRPPSVDRFLRKIRDLI